MKVAFINPYCLDERLIDYDIKVPPIGVYYLAAALIEAGYKCEIFNWFNMKGRFGQMERELKAFGPDYICISILHANRWGGIDISRLSKRILPDVPIIFGGPGATFLWQHLLKNFSEVDFIIYGEGEKSLIELINYLNDKNEKDLSSIKGIAYRKNGTPVLNDTMPLVENLDELPDPAKYFSFQHIISSRGCPWNCKFCGSPRIWNRRVRFHSPEYFVNQMERLHRKGINFFFVSDDTFTLKRERVIRICKMILEQGLDISWVAISRVNIVDDEILYWMRRAGCIQISYGVESGAPEIRKILNKNITNDEIKRAFKKTREYGLMPRAYFIYGNPGESRETINQTIRLIKEIKPLGAIFYILDIFPGTELYDDFLKKTKSDDDIWLKKIEDIMYFETDPSLDEKKILSFGRKLRKEFYKNLPKFALNLKLKDDPTLSKCHADFLSRLAMTFAFGDYANQKDIPNKSQTAQRLFERALTYQPIERAYLGLGMLFQRENNHKGAIKILKEGLCHFPDSSQLNTCLAVSLMNQGRVEEALNIFMRFLDVGKNAELALACAKALKMDDIVHKLTRKLR